MAKLTRDELHQLQVLQARVDLALEVANSSRNPAPEALREFLVEALARLRALASESDERPNAVEIIERTLAAMEAWHRWQLSAGADRDDRAGG
jgi:CRISPR/Cas system CSM-associated protein Csm2 small subunit